MSEYASLSTLSASFSSGAEHPSSRYLKRARNVSLTKIILTLFCELFGSWIAIQLRGCLSKPGSLGQLLQVSSCALPMLPCLSISAFTSSFPFYFNIDMIPRCLPPQFRLRSPAFQQYALIRFLFPVAPRAIHVLTVSFVQLLSSCHNANRPR